MAEILAITGPIYIVIGLGYLSVRLGLFAREDMRVLGRFVVHVPLPAMLFNAVAQRPITEVLAPDYLLVYAGGSVLAAVLGLAWARRAVAGDLTRQAYFAFGMSCSNSGFLGFPIALLVVGPVAGMMVGLNVMVENLLLVPFFLALAEAGRSRADSWQRTLRQSLAGLLRNPMVLGLLVGLVFSLLGWRLPAPLARTVDLLAQVSAPAALFVIGGTLYGLQLRGRVREVAQITAGKLLLHPLSVAAVLWLTELAGWLTLAPPLRVGAVLLAACPVMGIYPIVAQRHAQEDTASAVLLATTVLSFATISALLALFNVLPGWRL